MIYLFVIIYGLVHLPFLVSGFGEPDAWRNGLVALNLALGKGYLPARFPGFPVVEMTYGSLAKVFPAEHLWIYTNLMTLILSIVAIYSFYQILRFHKFPHPLALMLILFFIPILFVNVSSSMDYLWTVCFILLAYWFLLKQNSVWGGIFLGLAVGCRLTTMIFLIPFLMFLIWNPVIRPRGDFISQAIKFFIAFVIISLICYLPLFVKYKIDFLTTLYPPRDFIRSGYYIMQYIWGIPGLIALILFLIKGWRQKPDWNWELSFWCLTLFCYLFLFLIKPEKVEYLIPVIPFMVLLIGRFLGKYHLYWLAFLVIINNLVSFGIFEPGKQKFQWIDRGIAWQKLNAYNNYFADAKYLINYPYPPDSTVVAGWRLPGIEYIIDTPSFKSRKKYLEDNRIVFSYERKGFFNNNSYYVFGSFNEKQNDPIDHKRIIYPHSFQK